MRRAGLLPPLVAALALALATGAAAAGTHRSAAERASFKRLHPCPATGLRRGSCPGYVIDHMQPLCAGGADRSANMQWQTAQEAKVKDRWERRVCRQLPNPSDSPE